MDAPSELRPRFTLRFGPDSSRQSPRQSALNADGNLCDAAIITLDELPSRQQWATKEEPVCVELSVAIPSTRTQNGSCRLRDQVLAQALDQELFRQRRWRGFCHGVRP